MKKENFTPDTLVEENKAFLTTERARMHRKNQIPMIEKNEPSSWLVAIACLSFFPLMYLIGKTVMTWLT